MESQVLKKPWWLKKKIDLKLCHHLKCLLRDLNLHTICEESGCPNISECFARGTATFLILGDVCTRNCRFCGVKKGRPMALDEDEPQHVAEAVRRLGLKHAVITSVTRDDLEDGGAAYFAKTIEAIKTLTPQVTIEVLIPDFQGNKEAIKTVVEAGPDIIGHNVETVPRLYPKVRPKANYRRSLEVLETAKKLDSKLYTKSGLMLGLGERASEVTQVCQDLRAVNCDFLSLGQYLPPKRSAYPVKEYIFPQKFDSYKKEALKMGFLYVASGPFVRSSYLAEEYLKKMNEQRTTL